MSPAAATVRAKPSPVTRAAEIQPPPMQTDAGGARSHQQRLAARPRGAQHPTPTCRAWCAPCYRPGCRRWSTYVCTFTTRPRKMENENRDVPGHVSVTCLSARGEGGGGGGCSMATRTSFCSWSTRCESPSLGLSHGVLHEQKLVRVTALLPRSCPCPYKSVTFPDNLPGSRYRFPRSLIREEKTAPADPGPEVTAKRAQKNQ